MKSRELQRIFWDWLSTAERLNRSLAEQQAALTLRDVARVESIQPELETMMAHMKRIMPSLRSIVDALNPAEAKQLETLSKRIEIVGKNVQDRVALNRKLIENEMGYVGGTLALLAKVAQQSQGQFSTGVPSSVLVDAVA
jgi:hypothetical protein